MMKSWREARNDRILKYVLEKGVSFGESVLLRPREMVISAFFGAEGEVGERREQKFRTGNSRGIFKL